MRGQATEVKATTGPSHKDAIAAMRRATAPLSIGGVWRFLAAEHTGRDWHHPLEGHVGHPCLAHPSGSGRGDVVHEYRASASLQPTQLLTLQGLAVGLLQAGQARSIVMHCKPCCEQAGSLQALEPWRQVIRSLRPRRPGRRQTMWTHPVIRRHNSILELCWNGKPTQIRPYQQNGRERHWVPWLGMGRAVTRMTSATIPAKIWEHWITLIVLSPTFDNWHCVSLTFNASHKSYVLGAPLNQ